jgi:hypothetical protein
MERYYERTAFWLLGVGMVFLISFTFLYLFKTDEISLRLKINTNTFSSYGSFIGGILGPLLSLASIFLVLKTLADQKSAFIKEQIESRFYQMIAMARDNSNSISLGNKTGKHLFLELLKELYDCYDVVLTLLATRYQNFHLPRGTVPNIAYLAFFFGAVGPVSEEILRRRLHKTLSGLATPNMINQFSYDLIQDFKIKRNDWTPLCSSYSYLPFDGHQSRLGHYYRHLFQVVTYINEQPHITYDEKYQYIKTLRAQFSTQEQVLLFCNSISELGKVWELGSHDDNKKLITKFNLIKNIPDGFLPNCIEGYANPRLLYPKVRYEDNVSQPIGRDALEATYS